MGAQSGTQPLQLDEDDSLMVRANVRFVLPRQAAEEPAPPPIDVTPSRMKASRRISAGQHCRAPPQRVRTATGAIWEEPDSKSWMK